MDVDSCIRENIPWLKLPEDVRTLLGSSQREYDKMVLEYSIRNQLRYKGNLVRHVKKNEETYYDMVMKYSESHLMIFPYHLADIVVKELRITPFNYYINILMDMINSEKSYDSLPNFTAADAMRLLGIGRNQYIDLMNQNRSNRKFLRRNRPLRELLPQRPAKLAIEPWWVVCAGSILEADIKPLTEEERRVVDGLLDEGPQPAGLLPATMVQSLFHRGLVYFDVPVRDTDYVYVAPLDGFVMNRVLGDYFETLLYKIFVAIDDQTTVKEIADMLHIDGHLVCTAISVFCRLGFARKRVTGMENAKLHFSWAQLITIPTSPTQEDILSVSGDLGDLSAALASPLGDADEDDDEMATSMSSASLKEAASSQPSSDVSSSSGRAALLFDSSLAAFLMMGNLSTSLKGHAVTLFEVGKLADEQMGDFMEQLESVNHFGEGEAQRYSEHAVALLDSLKSLKKGREVDLLRGESLLSLDPQSRMRVLAKAYGIIVATAPLSFDACTLPVSSLPFIGPPIPEICSPWFRLAIYHQCSSGPSSLYFPRGTRLSSLPRSLSSSPRLLVSTANHEPQIMPTHNALLALNDILVSSPLFVQSYSSCLEDELVYVPFPFDDTENEDKTAFSNHPAVVSLTERVGLNSLCGYVVLLKTASHQRLEEQLEGRLSAEGDGGNEKSEKEPSTDEKTSFDGSPSKAHTFIKQMPPGHSSSDFVLLDCVFGIPLFHSQLNATICQRLSQQGILEADNRTNIQFANKAVVDLVNHMLDTWNFGITKSIFGDSEPRRAEVIPPVQTIRFDPDSGKILAGI